MVSRQRENVAKYLYDLSKIVLAATVVGNLVAWKQFDVLTFLLGGISGLGLFGWGYRVDGAGVE
ncbi:MAG: hypothetical protein COV76_03490 [Candidatus Omnitrophica bacterium CG11_big_fil_rev_8_21_14_0_20_64_10]|nr:MAG: hypothetical protein COV76_03490 [Candidatus Omnitrophica bacterium CG11_big_fil_rev_8_21_14_0_20_64_10]